MIRIHLSLSFFLLFNLQTFVFANIDIREYETPEQFIARTFMATTQPKQSALWLTSDLKKEIQRDFDYQIRGLRVKYWENNGRTAWMLDEIGKEQPITLGVVVENNSIDSVSVLIYRESRGGEIRYPFFTDQFKNIQLIDMNADKNSTKNENEKENQKKKYKLNKHIDGITGATLSVNATKKITKVALFLHELTQQKLKTDKKI